MLCFVFIFGFFLFLKKKRTLIFLCCCDFWWPSFHGLLLVFALFYFSRLFALQDLFNMLGHFFAWNVWFSICLAELWMLFEYKISFIDSFHCHLFCFSLSCFCNKSTTASFYLLASFPMFTKLFSFLASSLAVYQRPLLHWCSFMSWKHIVFTNKCCVMLYIILLSRML